MTKKMEKDDYEGIPPLSEETKATLKAWKESRKKLKKVRNK